MLHGRRAERPAAHARWQIIIINMQDRAAMFIRFMRKQLPDRQTISYTGKG